MDKIDIKDLRIDNLVYSSFSKTPCKVTGIILDESGYGVCKVTGVNGYKDVKSLSPIPITSDICDQVNDDHVILLWDDKKYEETGDNWYELDICNIPDKTVCINIQYVHILQNLLRDLGIEKEIII
jgi:hypothetical protein